MKRAVYRANWKVFIWTSAGILSLLVLGYLQNGVTINLWYGFLIGLIAPVVALHHQLVTSVEIVDDRLLIVNGKQITGGIRVDIYELLAMRRVPALFSRQWDGRMHLYKLGMAGKLERIPIAEANFSNHQIKEIVTRLHQINPRMEIDRQYRALMAGEIKVDEFKDTPIDKTVFQVERELIDRYEKQKK